MTMLAYHGQQSIKDTYLARVMAHRTADELVKGKYWEGGKGCAVGCTIHGDQHVLYEAELGIPVDVAHLEDGIFENLQDALAMEWPERFLQAIKPGADLSLAWPRFAVWLLIDPKNGVICFAKTQLTKDAIYKVAALYQKVVAGGTVTIKQWDKASTFAYDVAVSDDTAAAACGDHAVLAGLRNAEAAAGIDNGILTAGPSAAYAADAAAGGDLAAAQQHYVLMADKLIEILETSV